MNNTLPEPYTFLELKEGNNKLRIVTQPYQYICHPKFNSENIPAYAQKLKCRINKNTCPTCELGNLPKPRWMLGVISRIDNEFYLLDIGFNIFEKLREIVRRSDWRKPEEYDVDIVSNATSEFKNLVIPNTKTPLSEQDLKIVNNINKDMLNDLCRPIE